MTGNLSLERGLSVLRVLRDVQDALGVRELSRRLDLSAPAIQRILNTLAEHGYVEQESVSRRYRLGPSLLSLAQHMLREDRLISAAQPELDGLAAEGCFNAFLGIRRRDQGIYLLAVQSKSPVVIRSSPGETFPLHSTALGKALLMGLSRAETIEILGEGPFEKLTPRTVTDPSKLVGQIQASAAIGFATSLDENFVGLIAVGAPILEPRGTICAAISVAYPRSVGPQVEIARIGEQITVAAKRISSSLGYRDNNEPQGEDPRNAA
jgi:DNA-binding IclR family transcriptional regulator